MCAIQVGLNLPIRTLLMPACLQWRLLGSLTAAPLGFAFPWDCSGLFFMLTDSIIQCRGAQERSQYLLALAGAYRSHSFQYICLLVCSMCSWSLFSPLLVKLCVCGTLFPSLIVLSLCIFRFPFNYIAGLMTWLLFSYIKMTEIICIKRTS